MSEIALQKLNNEIFELIRKILIIKDDIHAVVYYKTRKDNSSGKIAIYDLNKINLGIHDSFECEHVSFYYNVNNKFLVDVKLTNVPFSLLISLYNILHLEENNKYIDMEVQGEIIVQYESDDEKIEDLYFRSECRLLDLLLSSDKVKQVFVQSIYTGFHMVSLCENKIVFNQLDDITRANNEIVKNVYKLLSKDTITEIEFFVESVPGLDIHYIFNNEMSVFQISVILMGKKITDIRYIENGIAIHLPPNSIIIDTDGLIEISVEMNNPSIWKDSYYLTAKNLNNIHHSSMSENDIDDRPHDYNLKIFKLINQITDKAGNVYVKFVYDDEKSSNNYYICSKDNLSYFEKLCKVNLVCVEFIYCDSYKIMQCVELKSNPINNLMHLFKIICMDDKVELHTVSKNSEEEINMIKEEPPVEKKKGYIVEVTMSQGIGSMILLEGISRVCKGKVDELLKTIDYNLRFNPANQFITSAMFVNNLIRLGHLSILSHIMVDISFTEVSDDADITEGDFDIMIKALNDYSNLNRFNNEYNTAIRYQIDEDQRYEGNTCYDIKINLRSLVEMCQIIRTKHSGYSEFILLIDCISRCNNTNIEAKYLEVVLDETVNDFKDNTLKSRDLFEKFIPLVSNHEIRPYLHSMLRDVREDISIIDGMYREITSGLGSANNINRTHKAIMINNRGGNGYEDPSNIPLTFVVSGALPILEQALRHSEQLAITKLSGRCTDFNNSIIYFREPANSKDTNTIVKLLETIKNTIKETTKNINAPSEAERFYSCLVGTVSMMVITKPYRLVIKLLTERLAKDAQYEFRHIAKDMKQQIEQELLSSNRISEDAKERIRIDMEELEAIING